MTVKIDIGADPGVVVSAFYRIKDSLRDARKAAEDFANVDMSHAELAALENQIKRLTAALLEMQRASVGVVLSHGVPTPSGAAGPPPGSPHATPAGPPGWPPGTGTWVAPPGGVPSAPPPVAPPAPPPPRPPRPHRTPTSSGDDEGGAVSAIAGLLRGPIGFALSLAGVGGAASMIGKGVGQAETDRIDSDHLLRTLRDSAFGFDNLRDSVHRAAGEIGATFGDMSAMSLRYARIAGADSTIIDRTKYAAGFARGYGMDTMEGVRIAAHAENAGIDPKELAAAIGDALEQGGMQGRQDEVANAILKWGESANRQTGESHWHEFAGLYTQLNAGPYPGLRGANGESFLANMNNTIMQGGAAGEASQVFTSRALAAAGVRNLDMQQYALEGGMFQNLSANGLGGKNETVLEANMRLLDHDYGPGLDPRNPIQYFKKLSALKGLIGGNEHVDEQFYKDYTQGNIDVSRSQNYLQDHHLSLAEINPSGWSEISGAIGAKSSDLPGLRDKILGRTDLTDDERKDLKAASGEGLRESMVRAYAKHGMTENPGSRQTELNSAFSNSLTTAADNLVDPLNLLKTGVTSLTNSIGDAVTKMKKWFGEGSPGNEGGFNPDGSPRDPSGGGMSLFGTGIPFEMPISYRTGGGFGGGIGGSRFSSGSGGQSALSNSEVSARAQQAMRYFEGKGWSHEAAAGIVSNLINESSLREGAIGDSGQARGLMQWHGDRFADVSSGIGKDPTSSFEAGLEGVQYELLHGRDQGAREAGQFLLGKHSARENGAYFSMRAERPRDAWGNAAGRGAAAEELAANPRLRSGAPRMNAGGSIRAEPLKVIHMLPNGRVLREEILPMTYIPKPEIA